MVVVAAAAAAVVVVVVVVRDSYSASTSVSTEQLCTLVEVKY